MGLFRLLKKAWHTLENALFPEGVTCDVCGAELLGESRVAICPACLEKFPFVGEEKCEICGAPEKTEARFCVRCMRTEFLFQKNRAVAVYKDEAKHLVLRLKYRNARYLATSMSALMADVFLDEGYVADCLTFVPMSKKELKARGFNQAELLANKLGERLNIPVLPLLDKCRELGEQKKLSYAERAANLKGAFLCSQEAKDKRIVLVDDVFTTGSTANECARVLFKAKARDVSVLTFAVTEHSVFSEKGKRQSFGDKKEEPFAPAVSGENLSERESAGVEDSETESVQVDLLG